VEEETFKEATPAPPKTHGSGEIEHRTEDNKEPIYSLIVDPSYPLIAGELSRRWIRGSCMVGGLGSLVTLFYTWNSETIIPPCLCVLSCVEETCYCN
jgi:hypothetical protein